MTRHGDSTDVIPEAELAAAFENTNFGTDDLRRLLHTAVLKKAARYHCGHTITCIMRDPRLIGKNGELLKRGIELLRAAYGPQMRGGA